jgi:hypothetical protein
MVRRLAARTKQIPNRFEDSTEHCRKRIVALGRSSGTSPGMAKHSNFFSGFRDFKKLAPRTLVKFDLLKG